MKTAKLLAKLVFFTLAFAETLGQRTDPNLRRRWEEGGVDGTPGRRYPLTTTVAPSSKTGPKLCNICIETKRNVMMVMVPMVIKET